MWLPSCYGPTRLLVDCGWERLKQVWNPFRIFGAQIRSVSYLSLCQQDCPRTASGMVESSVTGPFQNKQANKAGQVHLQGLTKHGQEGLVLFQGRLPGPQSGLGKYGCYLTHGGCDLSYILGI